jgi:hypothetical protein
MSQTITRSPVVLEPASHEFVQATSKPPFLYELTPTDAQPAQRHPRHTRRRRPSHLDPPQCPASRLTGPPPRLSMT